MTDPTETAVDYRTSPPSIEPTATAWQAWWEDHDMWDGDMLYADLDTAKHHSAVAYVGEEYSWLPGDDPDDEAPSTVLTWELKYGRWRLLDGGQDTGVRLGETRTYAVVSAAAPSTDQAASGSGRAAEAELYVLLRKAGVDRYEAQALIDRHVDEVLHRAELRRLAAEAPATNTQAQCGCPHPADEHSVYGCADGCGCEWMPKKPPMDPVRILGIADCPTPESHNWGCGCPTDQLPLHAESGVDTPGCDCGHDGMGPKWHGKACAWMATLTVPHPDDEPAVVEPAEAADTETVHGCPPDGSGLTPCCGRTPFELPRTDRISSEAPVTCTGAAEAQQDGAQT